MRRPGRYGGEPPRRTGARHPSISPYGPFKVRDGAVFFGIQNEREWLVLCRDLLRRGDLATDPRFASNTGRVARNDPAMGPVPALGEHTEAIRAEFLESEAER